MVPEKVLRVVQALAQAQASGVARLDAQWILCHLLKQSRPWLLAHDQDALPPVAAAAWPELLARRAGGEPLAYVLGEREFCGLNLHVSPAVLVPRPETEWLVDWALECLDTSPSPDVIDLGTGSGAVALAICHARPHAHILATDASAEALRVAQRNARRLGLDIAFAQGDWWAAAAGQRFGLAVSNPPYIAEEDPHLAALRHEPQGALTAGADGLGALLPLIRSAPRHLLPGAWLLLEHGHDQADAVQALLQAAGFEAVSTRSDLAGLPRCTGGRWPAAK